MERLLFFVLVAVVFQCTQGQISSAVACKFVSGSKCKCTLADGTGEIDLSPLFGGGSNMLSTTAYVGECSRCISPWAFISLKH